MLPGNLNKMLAKAQKAQQQLQADIAALRQEGTAGGGAVRAVCDGNKHLLELTIAPEAAADADAAMLSDLVLVAVQDAQKRIDDEVQKKVGAMAGMMGLPPGLGF